ncbi:MAG: hypothetical protein AVDCRST_MAG38-2360, partial [uncultured Solirubrobacteraceae bacterium]
AQRRRVEAAHRGLHPGGSRGSGGPDRRRRSLPRHRHLARLLRAQPARAAPARLCRVRLRHRRSDPRTVPQHPRRV